MIETGDILGKFDTLRDYEIFRLEWSRCCVLVNPTEQNMKRYLVMKHRGEKMGIC